MIKVENINFSFGKFNNHRVIIISITYQAYMYGHINTLYNKPMFILDIDLETMKLYKNIDNILNNKVEVVEESYITYFDIYGKNNHFIYEPNKDNIHLEEFKDYEFKVKVLLEKEHNVFDVKLIIDKDKSFDFLLDIDSMRVISNNKYYFEYSKWDIIYEDSVSNIVK